MKKGLLIGLMVAATGSAYAADPSTSMLNASDAASQAVVNSAKSLSKETGRVINSGYEAVMDLFGHSSNHIAAASEWTKEKASASATFVDDNISNPASQLAKDSATSTYENVLQPVSTAVVTLSVGAYNASKDSATVIIETPSVQTSIEVSASTAEKLSDYTSAALLAVKDSAGVSIVTLSASTQYSLESEFAEAGRLLLHFPSNLSKAIFESGDYYKEMER